jgi:large subunit ribosomal protein L29
MNKKLDPLREKNAAELKDEETRLRKELFDLEFKHSTRQLTDTMSIRRNRRQIARVVTLQHQLTHSQASDTKATK